MADEDSHKATQLPQQPRSEQHQCDRVAHLANRLYAAANSAARSLLPITFLRNNTPDAEVTKELVHKCYALAAALSALLDDLTLERVCRGGIRTQDLWTQQHHENLIHSTEACYEVLTAISCAVRIADERYHVRGLEAGESYVAQFHFDDQLQARNLIEECLEVVHRTSLIVKHTSLTRFENLNTEEEQEALRITHVLQKPEFDAIWALKDEPFASLRVRAALTPALPVPAPSTNLPGIGSLSSPHDLILTNLTKPIWAYGIWPPLGSSSHGTAVATGHDSGNDTPLTTPFAASQASASKEGKKPGDNEVSNLTTGANSKTGSGTVTFGEPSVIKPLSSGNFPFGQGASTGPFSDWKPSASNAFKPTPHLEAYIVRPLVENTDMISTVSHSVESLRLSEEVLQAQVLSMGPDHSIMDTLLDLQPHVLSLIQSRAAQRLGDIVYIRRGNSVDVSTSVGSLKVRPAVFIISTSTVLPLDPIPLPAQVKNPATSIFKPTTGGGLFGNFAPTTTFELSKTNPAKSHFTSAEAYSNYLEEQGEECTWVESAEAQGLQHYQTITMNKKWHGTDRSFEEIRLADYEAGRRGPVKVCGISYPWDAAPARSAPGAGDHSRAAQPVSAGNSKTGWFPSTIAPSTPGYAFPAPAASLTSTEHKSSSPFSSSRSLPINNTGGFFSGTTVFSRPDTSNSAAVTSTPPTKFGTERHGFCTLQHLHSPFCRIPPSENKTSPFNDPSVQPSSSTTAASPFGSAPRSNFFGGIFGPDTFYSPGRLSTAVSGQSARDQALSTVTNHSGPPTSQQSILSGESASTASVLAPGTGVSEGTRAAASPLRNDLEAPQPDTERDRPQEKAKNSNERLASNNPTDLRSASSTSLFLGYLPLDSTSESIQDTLQNALQESSTISSVRVPIDSGTGGSKGFAYVDFSSIEEATTALKALKGVEIGGRPVRVDLAAAARDD